jgi:L,D-transpeptidase ErfK/SrfK
MNKKIAKALSALLLLAATQAFATSYTVPPSNEALIGKMEYVTANPGDNVVKVAKQYDIGFNAVENANPHVSMDRRFTPGVQLAITTQHLLPSESREGIVINLPEMRMYYFLGNGQVLTYPIGIGKIGKTIPITKTAITRKTKNPVWIPPEDIRQFNLEQGIVLPKVMPPGPDNPLGPYAIYMRIPTYLIHSTIFPESVGKRASFGCIRMYESDIEDFFPSIKSGIPVVITNKPVKLGWEDDRLFIEAHEPLEEHGDADLSIPGIVHQIATKTQNQPVLVDWQMVSYVASERDGVPHEIGTRILQN